MAIKEVIILVVFLGLLFLIGCGSQTEEPSDDTSRVVPENDDDVLETVDIVQEEDNPSEEEFTEELPPLPSEGNYCTTYEDCVEANMVCVNNSCINNTFSCEKYLNEIPKPGPGEVMVTVAPSIYINLTTNECLRVGFDIKEPPNDKWVRIQ